MNVDRLALQDLTIPKMLQFSADRYGENEALVAGSVRWRYQELFTGVRRTANALLELGVGPGDRVAVWLPNFPEWVLIYLAAASIGVITVPVNSRFRAEEAHYVLSCSEASVLVTTDHYLTNNYLAMLKTIAPEAFADAGKPIKSTSLPFLRRIITLEDPDQSTQSWNTFVSTASAAATPQLRAAMDRVQPTNPLAMFWTSGTTSKPKGAVVPHRVIENVVHYADILDYQSSDRCLASAPLFYTTTNYWVLLVSILRGACCVMQQRLTTEETLQLLHHERITVMVGMPNLFINLLKHPDFEKFSCKSLRTIWLGGANVSPQLAEEIITRMTPERVSQVYGMTETGGITTMTPPSLDSSIVASSVGQPMPNYDLKIVDVNGAEVANGELLVRSPYNLITYYGFPEAEVLGRDEWFATGDLFSRDAQGNFLFKGRLKDMIKVGGENVAAREVEEVLCSHDAVRQAAVIGIPDPERNEAIVAFVETTRPMDVEELREFCQRRLAKFKRPQEFIFRDDWPLGATGKIQKFRLRDEYGPGEVALP